MRDDATKISVYLTLLFVRRDNRFNRFVASFFTGLKGPDHYIEETSVLLKWKRRSFRSTTL